MTSYYFSFELLGIFTVFYISYKLKLQKSIISFLFRKQVVYLPLNDKDFEQLMEMHKNKNEQRAIVRSCEFGEYTEKCQSPSYLDFDFLILLYFCNFIIVFFTIISNVICYFFIEDNKQPFLDTDIIDNLNENNNNSNNSSSSSFSFENLHFSIYIIMTFLLYLLIKELRKNVFKTSFISKNAKEFYLIMIVCSIIFYLNEYFNESLFNINYNSLSEILFNRINIIITRLKLDENLFLVNLFSSKKFLKFFISFNFGLICGLFFRSTQRSAYFDYFFCNLSNVTNNNNNNIRSQNQREDGEIKSNNYMEFLVKIKSIINLFILFIFFEPYLDNFLEIIGIKNNLMKIFLEGFLLLIEFCFGFYFIWYSYLMFSVQNYQEILHFVRNPSKQYYSYHVNSVNFLNDKSWDVLNHVFINCFLPLFVFIAYLNQSDIWNKNSYINFNLLFSKSNVNLNKGFLDNLLLITFLAIQMSKGLFQNAKFYYYLLIRKKNAILY